jgi:hypothetical protein
MSGCMMLSKNMCDSVPAVAPIETPPIIVKNDVIGKHQR